MKKYFKDFDLSDFWSDNTYHNNPNPITQEMIDETENVLGYKLPQSYIELLRIKNGGIPNKLKFTTTEGFNYIITDIYGIGGGDLDLARDSVFLIEEWGYPVTGILFADCPSGGHDVVCLDYSECGNQGEPKVIHIDTESAQGDLITVLAENFENFIKGLQYIEED